MKIKSCDFMGFHGVFMDIIWSHMAWAFICSFSEAQKGAEDMGQIKALIGQLPVREATKNANKREFIGLEEIIQPSTQQQNQGLTPLCCLSLRIVPIKFFSLASLALKESLAATSFSLPFPSTSIGSASSAILSSLTH